MILQNIIKTPLTFSTQHLQLRGTNNKHKIYILKSAKEIILASWRKATKNRYIQYNIPEMAGIL